MTRKFDRDPIIEAHDLWIDNGWEDCADGVTAVTSLMRVHQLLTKRADAILAPIDLTFSRYELLVRLYFRDGSMPLSRLGRELQIHQTSITSLVDRLEKQDLIKRTPHPTDRRSTIAEITPAGNALVREAITRLNAELFSGLGLPTGEARMLIGLLTKMRSSWGDIDSPDGWDLFAIDQSLPVAGNPD